MSRQTVSYGQQTRPGRLTGRGTAWRSWDKVPVVVDLAHADGQVTTDVPGRADGFNGDQVCVTYRLGGELFIRWFPAADVRRVSPVEDDQTAGIVSSDVPQTTLIPSVIAEVQPADGAEVPAADVTVQGL